MSGDGSKALRFTSLTTSGTGVKLTSWRSSGAGPRRREDDDGAERLRRRVLGFRAAAQDDGVASRTRVRSPGGGATLNTPGNRLGVRAKATHACARRRWVGLEAESGWDKEVGDDRWSPPVIGCGRGRRRSGLAETGPAVGPLCELGGLAAWQRRLAGLRLLLLLCGMLG
jgi:hypothetical protein